MELSAIYIKIVIKKESNAIDKFERKILSNKKGINIFINTPSKIIGIVPIKMDLNNFCWKKYSKVLFENLLLNLKISFLKYQTNAKTLPNWITADKEAPGSSIPKRRDMIFKWAVLLTGINSVMPCIKPYKMHSKYSKNF